MYNTDFTYMKVSIENIDACQKDTKVMDAHLKENYQVSIFIVIHIC